MNKCKVCRGNPKLRCVKDKDVILYYYVVCSQCGTVSPKCDSAIVASQVWNGQNLTTFDFVGGDSDDD